ncbi:hypothetical protein BHM03_00043728 [Ensete ventricosum]|nr:hypothetical protein BHM03_00043728 [Ensete ventricosum]
MWPSNATKVGSDGETRPPTEHPPVTRTVEISRRVPWGVNGGFIDPSLPPYEILFSSSSHPPLPSKSSVSSTGCERITRMTGREIFHKIKVKAGFGSSSETGKGKSKIGGDVPRVDGRLAVARAFGDRSLKEHLSSDPDVADEIIDEYAEFLILASDGLWKVMSNQEAVDFIKDVKDPQAAARQLTEAAVARKSKDDISCIVVKFN